jgi:hypothetical protein
MPLGAIAQFPFGGSLTAANLNAPVNSLKTLVDTFVDSVPTTYVSSANLVSAATPLKGVLRDASAAASFGSLLAVAFSATTIAAVFRGAPSQSAKIFTVQDSSVTDRLFVDGTGNPGSSGTWTHTGALAASGKVTTSGGLQIPQASPPIVIGYVWTATDSAGNGQWQAASGGGGSGGIATSTAVVTLSDYSTGGTGPLPNSRRMQTVMGGSTSEGDLYPYFKRNANSASLADALRQNVSASLVGAIAINGADVTKLQINASAAAPQFVSFNNDMRVITTTVVTPSGASGTGAHIGVWKLVADFSGTGPGFTIALLDPAVSPSATQFILANVWWDGLQLQPGMIDFSPILPLINSRNVRMDSFKQTSAQFGTPPGANVTLATPSVYAAIPTAPIATIFPSSAVSGFIWWRANVVQGTTAHVCTIVPYEISGTPTQIGDAADGRAVPINQLQTITGFAPVTFTSPGQKSFQLYAFTDSVSVTPVQLNGIWMMGFFTA